MSNLQRYPRNAKTTQGDSMSNPDNDPMLIEERRQHILAIAQSEGRVRVRDLSKALGISQITIRKDLDHLQGRGQLHPSHGGAFATPPDALCDPTLQEEETRLHAAKFRIAAA